MDLTSDDQQPQMTKADKLGQFVRALLAAEPEKIQTALDAAGIPDLEEFLEDDDEDSHAHLQYAIWDENDAVYRCPQCQWELEGGECHRCNLDFDLPMDIQDGSEYLNQALNPDRVSRPRGDTPLRDEEVYSIPSGYSFDEYDELRRRGATRLMCLTFRLEFRWDVGIIAWADGDLLYEFAGARIKVGDHWKIHLGRRIELDEEDLDGSVFMETLLEDAVIYSVPTLDCKWETVEEAPGVWVTRIVGMDPAFEEEEDGSDESEDEVVEASQSSASSQSVEAREYESESESDEEDSESVMSLEEVEPESDGDEEEVEEEEEEEEEEKSVKVEDEDVIMDQELGNSWVLTPTDSDDLRIQKSKVRKLGRALRALLAEEPAKTQAALQANGIQDLQTFLSPNHVDDEDESVAEEPVWDHLDGVYRCSGCHWELQAGSLPPRLRAHVRNPYSEFDIQDAAEYTNEGWNPDRVSQARGSTPLREEERYNYPGEYYGDRGQYEELRQRGATRLMCLTFNLEFRSDVGIIAWADGDIYDEFAGPLMQEGDYWKIMLGRRIELDEEDADGSLFIEGLLEDALLYPHISGCKWETVEETPGVWVTRAIGISPAASNADADSDSSDSTSLGTYDEMDAAWERSRAEEDASLAPGYVPPALPVQACHYEASDAEEEDELDDDNMSVDGETFEDPDFGWGESEDEAENIGDDENQGGEGVDAPNKENEEEDDSMAQCSDDDSADSDFDSDEVLSGDEFIVGPRAGSQATVDD
ncbi:hypothetical protein FB45DRAFT_1152655 [Roridomyces roridus]|uniref:DUF8191 domain-containing protein n=1 Tax=Roridomyces roridus TaxID=1738132 RepID=A0AAD7BUG2_9AGAR|nr:hypothetical protein FB45DRAFT_1152655 [Roridomyces roridus]